MSQQTFNKVVSELISTTDKNGSLLNLSSIIVSEGDQYYSHYFTDDEPVDIRSIAKPIACLAIGAAIQDGLTLGNTRVNLNTHVWPLLSKYAHINDPANVSQWEKVTLLDCFRITLGHDRGLLFSTDIKGRDVNTFTDYIVNHPITGVVGKDFTYSNAGTFLVSTLITEYTDMNLDELVDKYIFSPMEITEYQWRKYGKYTAGCTGLEIRNADLHKIGRLLINNGNYKNKQLVPSNWVEKMRSPLVEPPTHRYIATRSYPKWSYGMNLWICEDGNYFCDGSDAQYLIMLPKKDTVITTLGHQPDAEPVSSILGAWK